MSTLSLHNYRKTGAGISSTSGTGDSDRAIWFYEKWGKVPSSKKSMAHNGTQKLTAGEDKFLVLIGAGGRMEFLDRLLHIWVETRLKQEPGPPPACIAQGPLTGIDVFYLELTGLLKASKISR